MFVVLTTEASHSTICMSEVLILAVPFHVAQLQAGGSTVHICYTFS